MRFAKASVATKLLVLVLLVATVIGLLSMRGKLTAARVERDLVQAQVQAQIEGNQALSEAITHGDDWEYIANIAREKLGLLEPDEIRFVDTSN